MLETFRPEPHSEWISSVGRSVFCRGPSQIGSAQAFVSKGEGVAMVATPRYRSAASRRVPCRVCPLNPGLLAHYGYPPQDRRNTEIRRFNICHWQSVCKLSSCRVAICGTLKISWYSIIHGHTLARRALSQAARSNQKRTRSQSNASSGSLFRAGQLGCVREGGPAHRLVVTYLRIETT